MTAVPIRPEAEVLAEAELTLRFLDDAGGGEGVVHLKALWDLAEDKLMIELDFRGLAPDPEDPETMVWTTEERGGCFLTRHHTELLGRFLDDAMRLDPRGRSPVQPKRSPSGHPPAGRAGQPDVTSGFAALWP